MASEQYPVSQTDYKDNKPVFEDMADELMSRVAQLSSEEASDILDISRQLGIKSVNLAYDFANKSMGNPAIFAFTGEAFKGLNAKNLSAQALQRAESDVRIISSAYGILSTTDIIKPYRLEFKKDIAPSSLTPVKYFKQKVTVKVVNHIKQNNIKDIIDLLPSDADACLDWKIIRAYAKVHKVIFKIFTQDGLKTPIAKRLKELRGLMCRTILEENIQSFNQLISFESNHFIYSEKDSKPGLPVFIASEF